MARIPPAQPRRSMATWHAEPATVPPAGFTAPLTATELAMLRNFRALPEPARQLIGDIVAALVPESHGYQCSCGWRGQRHEVVMSLPLEASPSVATCPWCGHDLETRS